MSKIVGSQVQCLENIHGYVASAAPEWRDDQYDLRYAIDPRARMQMRLIDYSESNNSYALGRYITKKRCDWIETVKCAPVEVVSLDESAPTPDERQVREAMHHLLVRTIVGDWYVAGFNVCEENGLTILLGHIHDHQNLETPADAYAKVNVVYPARELHLRLEPSDVRLVRPNFVGSDKPLFYDVHVTAKSGSHEYENLRVREFYFSRSREFDGYDARDWDFAGAYDEFVPTTRYCGVKAWPVINLQN